jgi:COP9 signalosome complex subunit 7
MDQAQTRALSALQPFIHLALTTSSPTPRFLADLITRATSAPGTYIFTELLQTPAIQSLRSADTPHEFQAYLTVLEIFSYGTFEEYKSMKPSLLPASTTVLTHMTATPKLPALSDPQALKLRQLTLLSFAFSSTTPTYANLITALSLPTPQSLETLITSSIYAGLLTARLSPASMPPTVHITSVAPLRDLRPQSLPQMLAILAVWEQRCQSTISDLESQINGIRADAAKRLTNQKKRQEVVDNAVLQSDDKGKKVLGDGPVTRNKGMVGNKRDLDEQQEDDEYEVSSGDGVTPGMATMEVDEPPTGQRSSKRISGKKPGAW